jgi:hypothetical protein
MAMSPSERDVPYKGVIKIVQKPPFMTDELRQKMGEAAGKQPNTSIRKVWNGRVC